MHKKCGHPFANLLLVFLVIANSGQSAELANGSRVQYQGNENINLILHWSTPVEVNHEFEGNELILVFNKPIERQALKVLSTADLADFVYSEQTGYDSIELSLAVGVVAKIKKLESEVWINLHRQHVTPTTVTKSPKQERDLKSELANNDLSDEERNSLLKELLNTGGQQQVRAYVRRLALSNDPEWVTIFREQLKTMHQDPDLRALLVRRGQDSSVTSEERREIVYTLLSLGDKLTALSVQLTLAEVDSADSQDVEELLFLWGPRPPATALEWLSKRAIAETDPAQQAAWLRHLINVGGANRVVELIETQIGVREPELRAVRIAALDELGQGKALKKALPSAIAVENNLERLTLYAQIAEDHNYPAIAQKAWQSALSKDPGNARALRQLGVIAFEQEHWTVAQKYLTAYLNTGKSDFEANYMLAETLRLQKRGGEAKRIYERVLAQLHSVKNSTIDAGLTEAKVLNRLGRTEASEAEFKRLLEHSPEDRIAIISAYAQELIDTRHYKKALDVLDLK
jgi:tetratricopeptide (TPR) repeat protein